MFGRIGDFLECTALLVEDKAYKVTHPELWESNSTCSSGNDNKEDDTETKEMTLMDGDFGFIFGDKPRTLIAGKSSQKENQEPEEKISTFLNESAVEEDKEENHKKADALNSLYENLTEEDRNSIISDINNLEKMFSFLKKNIKGELRGEDVIAAEKEIHLWVESVENLKEI